MELNPTHIKNRLDLNLWLISNQRRHLFMLTNILLFVLSLEDAFRSLLLSQCRLLCVSILIKLLSDQTLLTARFVDSTLC